jgi:cytoskeletal protein CcmA (bactofilin family)
MIGSVVGLMALTGLMVALPLAPSLLEFYLRRDTKPMPVQNCSEMVPDQIHDFRRFLQDNSAGGGSAWAPASTLVLDTDWFVEKGVSIPDPIYAKGRLTGGGSNVFTAIYCEEDVDLGRNTSVMSWVHAQGGAVAPAGNTVHGCLSAGEQVELGKGCSFERVDAPVITVVGGAGPVDGEHTEAPEEDHPTSQPQLGLRSAARQNLAWNPEPVSILERVTERLFLLWDFVLQPGQVLRKNVVARGEIRLLKGSHVIGCLKSNRDMDLGPNVRVEGSLVSACDLRIGPDCLVMGPILAEGELVIESGTRIGSPKHPTTVQASRIRIAPGVTLHGSLCASRLGQVIAD